jgi:hypothetical protein
VVVHPAGIRFCVGQHLPARVDDGDSRVDLFSHLSCQQLNPRLSFLGSGIGSGQVGSGQSPEQPRFIHQVALDDRHLRAFHRRRQPRDDKGQREAGDEEVGRRQAGSQ